MMETLKIENAIAISAEFHTHKDFSYFYKQFADELNGFTGVFILIAGLAEELSEVEAKTPNLWDNHDWLLTVVNIVEYYIEETLTHEAPACSKYVVSKALKQSKI